MEPPVITAIAAAAAATVLITVIVKAVGWFRQPSTVDHLAIEAGVR
jgi:hypothetical protein